MKTVFSRGIWCLDLVVYMKLKENTFDNFGKFHLQENVNLENDSVPMKFCMKNFYLHKELEKELMSFLNIYDS